MTEGIYRKKHLTSSQVIILGFAGVILLGAFLLMLPVASAEGVATSFHEALFTSTSAVCVTGLVVQDTGSYWSFFGQTVILALIQIGGLGVVTVAAAVVIFREEKSPLCSEALCRMRFQLPKWEGLSGSPDSFYWEHCCLRRQVRCFYYRIFVKHLVSKESGWLYFIQYLHFAMRDLIYWEPKITHLYL